MSLSRPPEVLFTPAVGGGDSSADNDTCDSASGDRGWTDADVAADSQSELLSGRGRSAVRCPIPFAPFSSQQRRSGAGVSRALWTDLDDGSWVDFDDDDDYDEAENTPDGGTGGT